MITYEKVDEYIRVKDHENEELTNLDHSCGITKSQWREYVKGCKEIVKKPIFKMKLNQKPDVGEKIKVKIGGLNEKCTYIVIHFIVLGLDLLDNFTLMKIARVYYR